MVFLDEFDAATMLHRVARFGFVKHRVKHSPFGSVNQVEHKKPTIFFSHSSRDKKVLAELRSRTREKTGDSITIFSSSDGQSIPFGHNWVSETEQALGDTKLMFAFLSSSSLEAPEWVCFEAGHAYARKIRVVPVGILGVDLNNVRPPLSLLQGFNVTSYQGLNNIIETINDTFGFRHAHGFTEQDFREVFATSLSQSASAFGSSTALIDSVVVTSPSFDVADDPDFPVKRFKAVGSALLTDQSMDFVQTDAGNTSCSIRAHAMRLHGIREESKLGTKSTGNMYAEVDPLLSKSAFELLDKVLPTFGKPDHCLMNITFRNRVFSVNAIKASARLYGTGVGLEAENLLTFRGTTFRLDNKPSITEHHQAIIHIRVPFPISAFPFNEFLEMLFDRGVLAFE